MKKIYLIILTALVNVTLCSAGDICLPKGVAEHDDRLSGAYTTTTANRKKSDFRLATLFRDNMVLQQNMAVPVWGWARQGVTVRVEFAGQTKTAVADKDGRWAVKLDSLKANAKGRDLSCTVIGGETISFSDVLVGEVWICSGQSNMDWPVSALKG